MLIGYLLKTKAPDGILKILSFVLFAGFGIFTVYQGLSLLQESLEVKGSDVVVPIWLVLAVVAVVFAGLCLLQLKLNKKSKTK